MVGSLSMNDLCVIPGSIICDAYVSLVLDVNLLGRLSRLDPYFGRLLGVHTRR